MNKIALAFIVLLVSPGAFSQAYRINWGEEIKLKKGTADLDIIAADNTGLYFTESRLKMKSYFIIGATYGGAIKLYKVDKNFGEVFEREYKRELKGFDFHSFQTLGTDLYMFATDYEKREKNFIVYGAKVDKNSGALVGDFLELGSYQLESKKDDYEMKMTPINNGNSFLMVSNISAKDRVSIGVRVLDRNFKIKEDAIINLSFDPGHYSLQDVKLINDNKIVLLGKEFEETQVGKKKRKRLVFKQYSMAVYSNKGRKDKDIQMETGSRFIINGKLIEQQSGDLLLAGFFSNTSKKDDLNGFFINRVDIQKGELALSSFKEINAGMLGESYVDDSDDDDETREEKKQAKKAKDDDEEEEFPNEFIIRSVDINPADNSIIITSEVSQYRFYTYRTAQYDNLTKTTRWTTYTVHSFTNKDLLVISADKEGNIRWLNAIPKSQREEIRTNSGSNGGISFGSDFTSYFAGAGGMPYYSSFTSLINNNQLVILLNDHTNNDVNPEYGKRVKAVYNFRKRCSAYGVAIDLTTGKMTRKVIASNSNENILMPRHAFILNNEVFLPSWRIRTMAKTELKFAKITVK